MITPIRMALVVFAIGVLLYVSWTDIRSRRIPNVVIFPAIAVALVTLPWTIGLSSGLVGAVLAPLPLVIARFMTGAGKMGMGDIKLAVFVGLVLGYELALIGLGIGLVLSLIGNAIGVMRGTHTFRSKLPFGPYFAAAVIPLLLMIAIGV